MATYADRLREEYGYQDPLPFSEYSPEYAERYRSALLAAKEARLQRPQPGFGVLTGVRGAALRDYAKREASRAAGLQTLGHRIQVRRRLEERRDALKRFNQAEAAKEAWLKAKHEKELAKSGLASSLGALFGGAGRIIGSEVVSQEPWEGKGGGYVAPQEVDAGYQLTLPPRKRPTLEWDRAYEGPLSFTETEAALMDLDAAIAPQVTAGTPVLAGSDFGNALSWYEDLY